MTFIWSTRGLTWGFKFLRDGGSPDPLVEYEKAFAGLKNERETWRRSDRVVALRFPTPEGYRDSAGRVISQEFVVFGALALSVNSVQDGIEKIWPKVAAEYSDIWNRPI